MILQCMILQYMEEIRVKNPQFLTASGIKQLDSPYTDGIESLGVWGQPSSSYGLMTRRAFDQS